MPDTTLLITESERAFPQGLVKLLMGNSRVVWSARSDNASEARLVAGKDVRGWYIDVLAEPDASQSARVYFNYEELLNPQRLSGRGLNTELLVRAVRGRRHSSKSREHSLENDGPGVLDATAGLGRDAFLLAAAGFRVTALEKNRLLAFLLQEAIALARRSEMANIVRAANQLQVLAANSHDYFAQLLQFEERPDIVYLDPMYRGDTEKPAKGLKTSAAVKKHAQLLQCLDDIFANGAENEGGAQGDLLEQALCLARQKVVVKRAPKAPYLGARKPASSLAGKAVRYDIYPC